VSAGNPKLTRSEIDRAFAEGPGAQVPVILSPQQLAGLVGISTKTMYEWIAKGRLDGAFRKRGKHVLIWRDRAIDILFNGKEWSHAG
jgi:excisionase family DNA binding protein